MKIAEVYSHLNGLEFLLARRKSLWKEIEAIIANVDAAPRRTKVSREKRTSGKTFFSHVAMNSAFKDELRAKGWKDWLTRREELICKTLTLPPAEQKAEIQAANEEAIASYNQTDFVKDRVAIEIQFGKYSFVAYDLFVKHLAFYVRDQIDVGVEILPMKCLQRQMSSGVAYYEGEFYNVIRQGRGVPAVPLVMVGIEP